MASSLFAFKDKMTKFSLEGSWSIENIDFYRYAPRRYKPLESPVFYAPEHDLQFTILFYPNGGSRRYDNRDKNFTDTGVLAKSISMSGSTYARYGKSLYWKDNAEIGIDYTIEVQKIRYSSYSGTIKYSDKFKQPVNYICRSGDFRHDLDHEFGVEDPKDGFYYYSDNNLELKCKINVSYLTDSFSGICCFPPSPTSTSEVLRSEGHLEKMRALLRTGANSDITLVAGDQQEFKVHKLHLSTHSAVFAAMFQHEDTFKEGTEKKVVIEDVSAEVMRTLLGFIYTGTVESREEFTPQLLYVSDKYEVNALKEACERQLSLKLTTDSVFSLLLHADLHSATTLKENCIKFATFHSANLMSSYSHAFKQFTAAARPELVSEVVSRVVSK